MLKMLGLEKQALDALIELEVIRHAADEVGLEVSPEEVRQLIVNNPSLQDKGVFIGLEKYRDLLAANRIDVSEFEEGMRFQALMEKLRWVITDSIQVTEEDVRKEFLRTSQQAEARFVILDKEVYKPRIKLTEEEPRAFFDENKSDYAIKEQRKAQYLLLTLSSVSETVEVTEDDVQAEWERQAPKETVDASHILVSVDDDADDEEARLKAEDLLRRARSGEDFAELARNNSDDSGTATQGGSLGQFGRDRMVAPFTEAAFALEPGQISDLVRTQYGFHIIKVFRHDVPNLENRRPQIVQAAKLDRASKILDEKAAQASELAETHQELQDIGKALEIPFEIRETAFFNQDADPYAERMSQQLIDDIFTLKEIGQFGNPVDHPQGRAVARLTEIKLAQPADYDVSSGDVRDDLIDVKALALLEEEAGAFSSQAVTPEDFEGLAQKQGFAVQTTQLFSRSGRPDPLIGSSPEFSDAAFYLPINGVSKPIRLSDNRFAVLQVKSRTELDKDAFQSQRDSIRDRLLNSWQDAYFDNYIKKIRDDLDSAGKIIINNRAIDQLTG